MNFLKHFFNKKTLAIFALVLALVVGVGTKEVGAATINNSTTLGYPAIGDVINNQTNPNMSLEKWVVGAKDSTGVWVQRGIISTTIDALNCQMDGCPTPQQLQSTTYNGSGAIGFTTNLMGVLFEAKPASSILYLASLTNGIFGSSPVYAQNLQQGSTGLNAILSIWQIFTNISYVFFVIVFVAIGFMIMFRQKVDPQTVVSVENSLPKIVIALILVTLSYAIAGLMIDISNIATVLFANALATFHNGGSLSSWLELIMGTTDPVNLTKQKNIFELLYSIGSTSAKNLTGPISNVVSKISVAISIITGPLAELILNVAILGALFKTFFALLGSYVSIIFLTITSPIIFLSSALPGKGNAVSHWIKDMLANTLVFPVTFIFLFLGAIIAEEPTPNPLWQVTSSVSFANPWIPFGLAGFGKADIGIIIKELVAFGIVMAAPTIPGMVKEFFETKESALSAGTAQGLQSTLQRIPIIGSMLG